MKDNGKKLRKVNGSVNPNHRQELKTSLIKKEDPNEITFIYEVQNIGNEDIFLQFPSAKIYDYELFTNKGKLVYRYSDGKMFAQVIKNVMLPARKSLHFTTETLPPLDKGQYSIIMWIAARGMDSHKEKLNFTID
ncbi:BsuPI-related putative proteinase inhibitor [Bacillus sp. OK048]|uniref:BsuPI-related putative proteinase inhibitor n=1 Tax=Bacillus sp. OK048 TaxID=1882761 RepID=UPI00088488DB|nr:BsuPI-related putative proteinase inhibitor [Bacillus sp. OK048]SDM39088.1 Intracellular proteinase inhibitor [Bacillus sp. OK048]